MTAPAPQTTAQGIAKVSYTHEAMIDLIISEPTVAVHELAALFGYSVGWISRVISSDAFQARLHERKGQLTDPLIAATLEERLRGVAIHSITLIEEKLSSEESASFALDALGLASTAMGVYQKQKAKAA
jgi:hypothetical protein